MCQTRYLHSYKNVPCGARSLKFDLRFYPCVFSLSVCTQTKNMDILGSSLN